MFISPLIMSQVLFRNLLFHSQMLGMNRECLRIKESNLTPGRNTRQDNYRTGDTWIFSPFVYRL